MPGHSTAQCSRVTYAKLNRVKHFSAVLLGTIAAALVAFGLACGGDDTQPHLNEGPVDDVHGIWQGTYMASDGSQNGAFCVQLDQDTRGLAGFVSFNNGPASEIGGIINEHSILLTWGPALHASYTPGGTSDIAAAGTMNGTSNNGAMTGTWIAGSPDVHGDFSANHTDGDQCSSSPSPS